MSFDPKIQDWSEAHVFYNIFSHKPGADAPYDSLHEYEWRRKMLTHAPNGELLLDNSFFKTLQSNSKLFFLHTTPNLGSIMEQGAIYPSGGCLIGGVYATPLFPESGKFRLHNLGKYIYEQEAPQAIYLQKNGNRLECLIIEVSPPRDGHTNLIGIDYTRMGRIHMDIYRELEYLLSLDERVKIYNILMNRIKKSIGYLNLVHNTYFYNSGVNTEEFFKLFLAAINHLPILGYFYFEVVSEYLMLFQTSPAASRAKAEGEFYNVAYKDLMFNLFPKLLEGKALSIFAAKPRDLIAYIQRKNLMDNFDKQVFLDYLAKRLIFLTNARLLNSNNRQTPINWLAIKWDFEHLALVAPGLLGHLIHRELRNFRRYPDFYFYFDQVKALQIWNYWNHMDIAIPFNGYIPKGETGINPAYPNLRYKIYQAKYKRGNSHSWVEVEKELSVKLIPRLVDLKFSLLRARHGPRTAKK